MAIAVAGSVLSEVLSASSLACNVPSGATTGDILVACFTQGVTGPVPDQTGWTLVTKATQGTAPQGMWYRLATGSEPASYTMTASSAGKISFSMHRLTGVDLTNPLDTTAVNVVLASGTSLVIPTMTTVTNGALAIYNASVQTTASTVSGPGGQTILTNTNGVDGRRQTVFSEARPTAGAIGTRTYTISATLPATGIGAAFRPAAVTGPTISRYNGSTWVNQTLERYNGSAWVSQNLTRY